MAIDPALIFVDVDGPLIPLKARPADHRGPTGRAATRLLAEAGNPLLDRLSPADGRRLLALRGQLVWATTWMAEANEVIAPLLGLPDLPVVDWPDEEDKAPPGLHWKTITLTRWAAGRAFVWIDDETTDADRQWVATHHTGPALLQTVDPHVGLDEADFAAIRRWHQHINGGTPR